MQTVFICIPTLVNAGAERFAVELACNVNKHKYKAYVVVTNKLDKSTAFYAQLCREGIEVLDVSDSSYYKEFKNIRTVIKEKKPCVIHTNVGAALHMLLPVWLEGKRVVHLFTTHSMGYRIFSGVKKGIMKLAFKTKKVVPVAICDTVKASVCDAYGLPEDKVYCIYNGVDTEKFPPKQEYCSDGVTRFVSVGTLYGIKNHSMLIEAFSIVKKAVDNVKLTIVGGGELYDELNEQIKSLGLENDVVLAGNRSNVSDYLSEADVYCCPSKVEGLPITVLEAMSVGLPIITTPAGGVVDIVKDGENGYIVPHGDAEEMAKKMILFASDIGLIKEKGAVSRKEVLNYDVRICADEYETLYERFLNR